MSNPRNLCCSNCREPLRVLTLDGHYLHNVEIDLCDGCCLIWFDPIESARLAGPGIAELIAVIHGAMSDGHHHSPVMSQDQTCAVCAAPLKRVFNVSKFGRTSMLQCPHGHGYYQTFMLYLAEKGFVRPMTWADVAQLTLGGRQIYCANCGAGLDGRPHAHCPYCQSAVGVLDPARLASAITVAGQAVNDKRALRIGRTHTRCLACGGPVDATRDTACPQCHAVVRRSDTGAAMEAAEAVIDAVTARYERQRGQPRGMGEGVFPEPGVNAEPPKQGVLTEALRALLDKRDS
ncbi:MAG: hypothetical protein V4633_25890 [Pseudomonadota bacterium]